MKLDPYHQQQQCSPETDNITFMRMVAEFTGGMASNVSGVVENGDFRFSGRYIFRTFMDKAEIIIFNIYSQFSSLAFH